MNILILGGGFGGVHVALELEKLLKKDLASGAVSITLVNRENFFLFTPMLHEVAASDLDHSNIVNPIHRLLTHTHFIAGDVESIDLERRRAQVRHGFDGHLHEIDYHYLVLSLGSVTNFFGIPGLSELSVTMKSLSDAIHLRNRLIAHLEEANAECCASVRRPLLTFVVAGGGFAGVETVAGINDFLRTAIRYYRNLREEDLRVVLVHSGPTILPELSAGLGRYAENKLRQRGVEMRLQTRVTGVTPTAIQLSDETLTGRTLIWTAGTSPHPLLARLPFAKERGRLRVDEFLEVGTAVLESTDTKLWALGDCAYVPDPSTGGAHPPTAQHALREARVVAENIRAALRGTPKRPFRFRTIGQLAAIGHRCGVANVFGLQFSGFLAWWMWRTIYLSKLPRWEKRLRVMLDWTLDVLFSKDIVQFESVRAPRISQPMPEVLVHAGDACSLPEMESPLPTPIVAVLEVAR